MPTKFQKLTRPNIKALPAGSKLSENGIVFERMSNHDGRYSINIMVDSQRIHRVVGRESDGVTRKQAEELIEDIRTKARRDRLDLPKGRKVALSFDGAAAKYIKKLEEEGGNDIPKKKQRLEQHLIPFLKQRPISQIVAFDIEKYKKQRLQKGAAHATINRELAALSHLFTKAVEWGWLPHKQLTIKLLKEDPGRITYLTQEQVARLIEAARADCHPHIYLFIMVALETSMRRSEILSVQLENIDIERRQIYLPKAKAGARSQPITGRLATILNNKIKSARIDQEWLFPSSKSSSGHVMNIEKPWTRVVEAAGLDPKHVVRHTLRHTAITHLVQAGVDLPTVKRISGHKTLAMVERYSHHNGEHIQSAMDKLENRYVESKES